MYITFEDCKNYILGDLPKSPDGAHTKTFRELLLERDFDIDASDSWGNTLVMLAVEQHNLYALQQLLTFKPNLEIQNELGYTALAIACSNRFINIVRTLLAYGADPESVNYAGDTPLDITYSSFTPLDELQKAILAVEAYSMTEQGSNFQEHKDPRVEEAADLSILHAMPSKPGGADEIMRLLKDAARQHHKEVSAE